LLNPKSLTAFATAAVYNLLLDYIPDEEEEYAGSYQVELRPSPGWLTTARDPQKDQD